MNTWMRWISITLLATSVACTEKGKPIAEHQGDQRAPSQPKIVEVPESAKPFSGAPAWAQKFSASKSPVKEILLPLAEQVLDPKRILDPSSLASRAIRDELIAFNHLLLQTTKQDQAQPEFMQLLKKYEAVLSIECGTLRDSCTGMRYLKISANSAQVVKLIAQSDSENYFKMVLFAIEMKDKNWDGDLIRMLSASPLKFLSQAETKSRDAVKSLLETALQQARDKSQSPTQDRDFLENVQAWNFSDDGIQNFGTSTQNSLYAMMANSHFLYARDGSLHPSLQRLLLLAEAKPKGFFTEQRRLHDQKLFSADSIGAKYIVHFDELYFIVDAVFTGLMSPQSGALLFGSSNKDLKELQAAVENYMRIEFLLALNESSEMAKVLFNANIQAQDLLSYFIRESAAIQTVWSAFTSRSNPLQSFSTLATRQRAGGLTAERTMKSLFDSIQKSISLASAYPHTLVLFHLLSQKRFEFVSPMSGHTYDSGDLMRLLFQGKIEPLLSYSENKETLNQFQLIYAFDMGLRTNLFKTINLDVDYFIADTLRHLNGEAIGFIDQNLNLIQTRFNQAPSYKQFKEACGEIDGKPLHRTFYFNEVRASPYYGQLLIDAFTGVSDQSASYSTEPGSLPKMAMGIYYLDQTYAEMIERARLDLGTTLRLGQAMLASLKSSLQHSGLSPQAIEAKTQLTRKALQEITERRSKVLSTAKSWYDDIGKCYWKASAKDYQTQFQTIELEKAYLRQIHRDIKKLRSGASETEKATIQARIQFKGLPSNFKGLDHISADGYLYSQVDLQIRFAHYITQGLTTDEGILPAVAPQVEIEFGQQLDVDVEHVSNSGQFFMAFNESQDEFVKAGLKVTFNGHASRNDAYLPWMSLSGGRIITWTDYLKSLVSLYRLEHELTGHNSTFTGDVILRSHEEILNFVKISPEERQLYSLLSLNHKFDPLYLDHRLLLYDIETNRYQDLWGLFDFPVRLMNEEQLGFTYDANLQGMSNLVPQRMPMILAGKTYYASRSRANRGTAVIPYNRDLDKDFDASVIQFVKGEATAIAKFHDLTKSYINAVTARPQSERPRADINIFISIQDPLLTETLIPSFRSNMSIFNRTTEYCFASDKPCLGFDQ